MRAWKLPADVDTDQLAPGATMKHGMEVTARHCLERVRPDKAVPFAKLLVCAEEKEFVPYDRAAE